MIPSRNTVRRVLPMSMLLLLGEMVAYLGDLAFAYRYGTSASSDAYIAAAGLSMLPALLIAACVSATFIPLYTQQPDGARDRFAGNALWVLLLFSTAACALLEVAAEPAIALLNPGFDAGRRILAVRLARIMLPSTVLMSASMALSSLLEAHSRFLAGPLSMLPRSVLMIVTTLWLAPRFGIYAIAGGALLSAGIQALMLAVAARKLFRPAPVLQLRDPELVKMLRLSLPAVAGMAVTHLAQLVSRAVASGLNVGDMTAMSCALQVTGLLNVVIVMPVTTVAYPDLSRRAARGDAQAVVRSALRYAKGVLLLMAPLVALGMFFREPLIRLLYGRGMFGEDSVRVTAQALLFQLPGFAIAGLRTLFAHTFYAFQDTTTPLRVGLIAAVVNIALCCWLAGPLGVAGLALASGVASAVAAALMCAVLYSMRDEQLAYGTMNKTEQNKRDTIAISIE